jgi:hypothetical protein
LEKILEKIVSSSEEFLENVDIDDVLQDVSLEISTDDEEEEGVWIEEDGSIDSDLWDDIDFDEGAALDIYEGNRE